jgi:glucan phosphoethanolaminetransferase (alkaline phosphatase superfamily)
MWTWRWVFLMNIYLISPVVVYEWRNGSGRPDKSVLFALVASVLWLLLVQLLSRRIWLTHALMFPLYLVTGIDLYVIFNYQTRLTPTMIMIIAGNMEDARTFLTTDLAQVVVSTVAVLAGYGYALWRIRNLRMTIPRAAVIAPLIAVVVVYAGVYRYFGSWPVVLLHDQNSPFGIVPQAYLTESLHLQEVEAGERSKNFRFGAVRATVPDQPEVYVLVVGESARRHNWSLYGYPRDTNPRLSKADNLIVFRDVIAQVAQTQVSVPLILTRGMIEEPGRRSAERSIVSLFHEVGFHTFWLSTQQREIAMAAISRYANEADVERFFERRHDIVLVDTVKEILGKGDSEDKKTFFLLHSLGSHFNLSSRYPREFAAFPDGADSLLSGTSAGLTHDELIGAYDNTILYTDYFLSQLIDMLNKRGGISAAFYIPDHGDNLRDDSRGLFGHAHSNEYDLPIPMLFWYSNEYAHRYPDKVEDARKNADRPMNTRAVFYSMTDMAGITLKDPDLSRLSVFSPNFVNVKRMVLGPAKLFDFDVDSVKWHDDSRGKP